MNAKKEFLDTFTLDEIEAVNISLWSEEDQVLYPGYTQEDMENLLNYLDREYDNGYGTQELYGTVWLTGGGWATRGEYDGSEWWQMHKRPELPVRLIQEETKVAAQSTTRLGVYINKIQALGGLYGKVECSSRALRMCVTDGKGHTEVGTGIKFTFEGKEHFLIQPDNEPDILLHTVVRGVSWHEWGEDDFERIFIQ